MKLKKGAVIFVFACEIFLRSAAALASWIEYGGSIEGVNTFESVFFETNLDFNAVGDDIPVVTMEISNNYRSSFELHLSVTCDESNPQGVFYREEGGGPTDTYDTTSLPAAQIPLSGWSLVAGGGGVLGTSLVPPPGPITLVDGSFIWDPGSLQTSPTDHYQIVLKAHLSDVTDKLQGRYVNVIYLDLLLNE